MEELKRFTDFESLKLAAKSTQKAASAKSEKLKEQSELFELLRTHLLVKKNQQKHQGRGKQIDY